MAKTVRRTAIADAEWVISAQLTVGNDNTPVGEPIVMHFADSFFSKVGGDSDLDFLIARRLEEAVPGLKKEAKKR